jgi:uncharacterized membrane protein YgcG
MIIYFSNNIIKKKTCVICKQSFCQSCVNRQSTYSTPLQEQQSFTTGGGSSNSSGSIGGGGGGGGERICVICRSILSPNSNVDELMKIKVKHLRSMLNAINATETNTCKDKRDLVELVVKNRTRFQNILQPNSNQQRQEQQNHQRGNNSNSDNGGSNSNGGGHSFNDTINNFMNNVQDLYRVLLCSIINIYDIRMYIICDYKLMQC